MQAPPPLSPQATLIWSRTNCGRDLNGSTVDCARLHHETKLDQSPTKLHRIGAWRKEGSWISSALLYLNRSGRSDRKIWRQARLSPPNTKESSIDMNLFKLKVMCKAVANTRSNSFNRAPTLTIEAQHSASKNKEGKAISHRSRRNSSH